MKAATAKEIKQELQQRSSKELIDVCLRLSRFKKENKELLTYLLYESTNERDYIQSVKNEIDEQFENLNKISYYVIKKGVRKILRNTKKYIRYSPKKPTEVELLLYFCKRLRNMQPSISKNRTLQNLYNREIASIKKKVAALHEDLQADYEDELSDLTGPNV